MRWVFISAGLTALAAATAMAIIAAGGINAPSAPGLIALAVVLAVGSAAVGYAIKLRHYGLAVIIGLGMFAGEVAAMLQTAQRITAGREAMRAPAQAQQDRRDAALAELAKAEASQPAPASRDRLTAAIAAQMAAETNVATNAAEKGCRENCRLLLQAAVDKARQEVEAARAEISALEQLATTNHAEKVAAAKTAVTALPPPQSATPLADNSGVPEWLLDLVEAIALSLAINLPASALIALGVKMHPAHKTALQSPPQLQQETIDVVSITPRDHAAKFGKEMLEPADVNTPISKLYSAYQSWCARKGMDPFPAREIGAALIELFGRTGLEVAEIGGKLHLIQASIRNNERLLPAQRSIGVST